MASGPTLEKESAPCPLLGGLGNQLLKILTRLGGINSRYGQPPPACQWVTGQRAVVKLYKDAVTDNAVRIDFMNLSPLHRPMAVLNIPSRVFKLRVKGRVLGIDVQF